jgi:hypothetical protein
MFVEVKPGRYWRQLRRVAVVVVVGLITVIALYPLPLPYHTVSTHPICGTAERLFQLFHFVRELLQVSHGTLEDLELEFPLVPAAVATALASHLFVIRDRITWDEGAKGGKGIVDLRPSGFFYEGVVHLSLGFARSAR